MVLSGTISVTIVPLDGTMPYACPIDIVESSVHAPLQMLLGFRIVIFFHYVPQSYLDALAIQVPQVPQPCFYSLLMCLH